MAAPQLKTKPNGIHYWEFQDPDTGQRRRVTTGTRDREVANRMGRDIIFGIDPRSKQPQKARQGVGQVTMQSLFDRAEKTVWAPSEAKSQATIRSNLKILGGLIGDELVTDMTYTRLEALVSELRGKGYAPATIKRKMDMVSIRDDLKKDGFDISDVTLHTLRHTCLTRLAQGGLDLLRLQKWAGHSDPKITAERYTHLTPGDLTSGLAILSPNPAPAPIEEANGAKHVIVPNTQTGANRAKAGMAGLN